MLYSFSLNVFNISINKFGGENQVCIRTYKEFATIADPATYDISEDKAFFYNGKLPALTSPLFDCLHITGDKIMLRKKTWACHE
jgi:hypothetical protein